MTGSRARSAYWELAREANLEREASAKAEPKPRRAAQDSRHSVPRRDIPAKVTGGAAFVQDVRLPGMVHGRVVRPPRYGARLEQLRRGQGQGHAGRHRGGARRQLSRRGGAARGAGINARLVLIEFAKWSGGAELPDPAKLYEQLMSLRSEDRVIGEKDAPVPAGAKVHRGDVPSALSGACRDRAFLRAGRVQGRQAHGLDPQPGRLSAARHHRQGARSAAARHPLHPRRGRRLLRPQRRRRRRLRRRHAGARRQWAAGAAAMDA